MSPEPAFDPTDPMQVAIRMEKQDGQIASMGLAFTNTTQNLTTAIQGLQQEVRDLGKGISAIGQLEHDRQSHSEGLARAFEAIAKLSAMHEQAWERHSAQEALYRERIAAESAQTREKLMRWSGGSIAASFLIGTMVALVVWIYLTDKQNNERDIDTLRKETADRKALVDSRFTTHSEESDARFDKIEGILIEQCSERQKPCQFR